MTHTYEVHNIRCGGCANSIKKELSKLFKSVEVDIDGKKVTVSVIDEQEIQKGAESLKKLGYPLIGEDSGMLDKAKSFVSCAVGKIS